MLVWLALMRRLALTLGVLAAALAGQRAAAQSGAQVYSSFFQTARAPDVVATSASQNVILGASASVARVCVMGPDNAYVAFGGVSQTVTTANGALVRAGTCSYLNASGSTNMAVVASTDYGTLVQTSMGEGSSP